MKMNFEKYKTTEEGIKAHKKWCDTQQHESCDNFDTCANCAIEWMGLDAEEEEKPMPCPFCGDECVCGGGYLECLNDNCCYSSGNRKRSDAEAIAAHNRVCKAVKAYKEKRGEVTMQFCEVCNQDSHKDTILNLVHQLYVAREEESVAHQMADDATRKRIKLEEDLCFFVGIVAKRNPEMMAKVNGCHSHDTQKEVK